MKYAINHPHKFRPIRKGYQDEDLDTISYAGTKRRAFCAFMLGLNQCTIAIVAEVLVIVYLSSLSSLLLIIMKYVSLAAVVKFDDMYAAALHDSAIQGAVGFKLFVSNKRFERHQRQKQIASSQSDNYQQADQVNSLPKELTPREQKLEEI